MPRRVFRCAGARVRAARGVFLVFAKKQENTGENAAMRFQKGESGNANGRPHEPRDGARPTTHSCTCAGKGGTKPEMKSPAHLEPLVEPLAHGKTTAGRRTPLFPIDPNNGSLN
jgi:hypothetical protein